MNRMQVCRSIPLLQVALLLAAAVLHGQGQSLQQKVQLTPTMVAALLSQQGLEVAPDQLEMPVHLSASGMPDLQVNRAELVAPQVLRVRVTCAQSSQCQPFLVQVHLPREAPGLLKLAALNNPPVKQARAATLHVDHLVAGQHATLVMEDKHMRILLPVIAIDSGEQGVAVRVASLDHKQSYQGVVESAALVRGVLP